MPKGGIRPNSGRKNKGLSKDTVYIAVSKETRNKLRQLAKDKKLTLKDFISTLLNNE
jgi:uncharacterized protein (UPF0297 family)